MSSTPASTLAANVVSGVAENRVNATLIQEQNKILQQLATDTLAKNEVLTRQVVELETKMNHAYDYMSYADNLARDLDTRMRMVVDFMNLEFEHLTEKVKEIKAFAASPEPIQSPHPSPVSAKSCVTTILMAAIGTLPDSAPVSAPLGDYALANAFADRVVRRQDLQAWRANPPLFGRQHAEWSSVSRVVARGGSSAVAWPIPLFSTLQVLNKRTCHYLLNISTIARCHIFTMFALNMDCKHHTCFAQFEIPISSLMSNVWVAKACNLFR